MEQSLQRSLYARLEAAPDRPALGFVGPEGTVAWRTWEQVFRTAGRVARQLAQNGLGRGDVCVLVLPSGELSAYLLLGTLLLGGVPLLIAPPNLLGGNSSLPLILRHSVRKTGARLVVCARSLLASGRPIDGLPRRTRVLSGEDCLIEESDPTAFQAALAGDAVAALQLTSGTTGLPRICIWKQQGVLAALQGMAAAMRLDRADVCVNWTPLYHDMGLVNDFLLCLTNGVPLAMIRPQDFVMRPALWLRALADTGATVSWAPNFGFAITARRVRDDEIEGLRLDRVRALWNAAERIHLSTLEEFHARFAPLGLRREALKTNYGLAENVGGATFSCCDGRFPVEWIDRDVLQRRHIARLTHDPRGSAAVPIVGVGRPCPDIRITILSRTGRPLPDGHVGEIALDTPSRMAGYLRDARATRRALRGHLLHTGDLGYKRGEELFWVGRVRERLVVRGKKFDPSDFEAALLGVAGLRDGCFAVFGVDDERRGTQRVILLSEVRSDASRALAAIVDEIRDRVYQQLGITVDDVVLVRQGTLTKTSSGKRRHRHFRQLYLANALEPFRVTDGGDSRDGSRAQPQ